ncbi:MAG: S66 peptidase family protein [Chloroflexota bacterium]
MILKPPKLNQNDLIGIVAPSLPVFDYDHAPYGQAKQVIEGLGFRLLEGETTKLMHRWSAGTPDQQAADINAMFSNPDVKAIIGHTGGFSSMGVVDKLDYELIKANPKPFIGLSDITVYHWAIFAQTGLVGFHGNDFTYGFGQQWANEPAENQTILADFYTQLLTSSDPIGTLPFGDEIEVWKEGGTVEGMLIGGNLKRFMLLAGTKYFPSIDLFDGAILFWEDIGETYYDIAIYFQKMRSMGILDRIGGLITCRPVWVNTYFDHVEHPSLQEMILELMVDYEFPILNNFKLGHHTSSLVLPIGCRARLDGSSGEVVLLESAVV